MAGGIYPYQLADGSQRYRALYRTSNGVPRQRRGFASRREAERWLTTTLASVYRGEVIATNDTFADYVDRWLVEHRPRLEASSYSDYEINVRKRLKPFFGAMKLTAITATDVRRYVAELAAAGAVGPKTINNSLGVLSVALGHAEEDGLIVKNPAASKPGARNRIKLPAPHVEMDYLRLAEIPRYLDGCAGYYRPLAETLIATGLRISEALALTFADIDWPSRTLRIVRSNKRHGQGSTKGDRSRSVDFGARLEGILRDVHATRKEHGLDDLSRTPVFQGPRGGTLTRSDVSRDLHKEALGAAALRRTLRLHDLRHTAAASWLASGLPMLYVQRQLGHSSITTTQEQYGHLEESFLRDAPARAEATIWGPATVPEAASGRRA
jgi:integrase